MDAESLAQVQQIVTSAVSSAITTLRAEIATSAQEVKRHTGILVEDLEHKLDLVVEGMQFLRQADADIRAEIAHESRETLALLLARIAHPSPIAPAVLNRSAVVVARWATETIQVCPVQRSTADQA